MKKLLFIIITIVLFIGCDFVKEKKVEKKSAKELYQEELKKILDTCTNLNISLWGHYVVEKRIFNEETGEEYEMMTVVPDTVPINAYAIYEKDEKDSIIGVSFHIFADKEGNRFTIDEN